MRIQDDDLFEQGELNLAPMIDVVFLLLIFFMVATTFARDEEQLDVSLPQAEAGQPTEVSDEISIVLFKDGSLLVNGESVQEADLAQVLSRLADEDDSLPVTIHGDAQVALQRAVSVMDACALVGLSDVGMMTQDG